MSLLVEVVKFFIYSFAIVLISKYLLVPVLRKISKLFSLSSKTAGNITGFATSIPELLTVSFSAIAGFIETGIFNILSSNVINLVQYLFAVYLNKNQKYLSNKAIIIDILMVILTIIIPIIIMVNKINLGINAVIIFMLLFILFYFINNNAHKLYLKKQDQNINNELQKEYKEIKNNKLIKIILNLFYLVLISISLYIVGNLLSSVLTNLSNIFNFPEYILGIVLGIVTSIPELITFIEAQRKEKGNKGNNELGVIEATNNLLTSNVMNLFAIQSIGILLYKFIF